MTIADETQKPRAAKKLAKSLDAIAALRIAMEQRLAEAQHDDPEYEEQAVAPPSIGAPEIAAGPAPSSEAATFPSTENEPRSPPAAPPSIGDGAEGPSFSARPEPATQLQESATLPPGAAERESPRSQRSADRAEAPADWSRTLLRVADKSQRLLKDFIENGSGAGSDIAGSDTAPLFKAMMDLSGRLLQDPQRLTQAQLSLWQGYVGIWNRAIARMQGQDVEPYVSPSPLDRRFQDKDWQNIPVFDFIKQSYLMTSQWAHGLVREQAETLDPKVAHRLDFYVDQMLDAIAPSNFWMTNPEVLRKTFETGGENLVKGLGNLLDDIERGRGKLRISMSDQEAFTVGRNLAITPGKVIFRNDMMELLQYDPVTPTVFKTPMLIVPPWINKFYILDLREKNSFIRYLVSQGHTVFCISWRNPDATHRNINFDDYMAEGALSALREIGRATGETTVNATGYCIGGTLLAATLGYLAATPKVGEHLPTIRSATYLVTMVDFSEPGDLGVFIDEEQVSVLEEKMEQQGYLDAASMAMTFNMLRANDLIWSFVINNYLLGKDLFPFDILFWNSDSTNLPAAMHSFYLRKMYMDNLLCKPAGLSMKNVPIDLRRVEVPSFLLSTREDHIAPWRSTYAATQIYKGPVTFVLSGSGHIAGVVNPANSNKYGFWRNDATPPDADAWLEGAVQENGSWWPAWMKWLEPFSGEQIGARATEGDLGPAPGTYVLSRNL